MNKQEAIVQLVSGIVSGPRYGLPYGAGAVVDDAETIYKEIVSRCLTDEQKQSILQPSIDRLAMEQHIEALKQQVTELSKVIEANNIVRDAACEVVEDTSPKMEFNMIILNAYDNQKPARFHEGDKTIREALLLADSAKAISGAEFISLHGFYKDRKYLNIDSSRLQNLTEEIYSTALNLAVIKFYNYLNIPYWAFPF